MGYLLDRVRYKCECHDDYQFASYTYAFIVIVTARDLLVLDRIAM